MMTVAMLVRGASTSDSNAILADLVVGTALPDGTLAFDQGEQDKIRVIFDKTYASVIGDPCLLQALGFFTEWQDPARPDLHDAAVFDAILVTTERIRQLYGYANDPGGAVLLVCTPAGAYYWQATYDAATKMFSRPSAPTDLEEGSSIVFFGDELLHTGAFAGSRDPIPQMQRVVAEIIDAARSFGKKIKYDPRVKEGRFSAVAVPCDVNEPVTRVQAFRSMPELLANYFGSAGLALLHEHPEFREFPMSHG